jgi:hypothetical protein
MYKVSFLELAIAAHIMTGGATASGADLCSKTKLMKSAFQKYHKQKIKANGSAISYKTFFEPIRNVKTLGDFGASNIAGISRAPHFEGFEDIWRTVRIQAWRAAHEWR